MTFDLRLGLVELPLPATPANATANLEALRLDLLRVLVFAERRGLMPDALLDHLGKLAACLDEQLTLARAQRAADLLRADGTQGGG